MDKKIWDLFIAFTRASNLGFGGGPAVVPLIKAEAVDRYKWMGNDEFADSLAIGNALPGPIATKMAAYIGYKVSGWLGVLAAILGTIGPSILVVVFLGNLIINYSDSPALTAMLTAVRPFLETRIDAYTAEAPELKKFILPGGSKCASLLHIARTITRRAERRVVALMKSEEIHETVLRYLNRLSDYFFAAARVFSILFSTTINNYL